MQESPVRGARFIHKAILTEARKLEDLAAEGRTEAVAQRLPFLEKVLHLHNTGEEVGLFPDLDAKMPEVVPAYLLDHREEKQIFAGLQDACAGGGPALIKATSALATHLRLHIKKEEELIIPIAERLFTTSEQSVQVGRMLSQFTPADMAEVLPWMVTSLEIEDRRAYLNLMEKALPPERFAGVLGMVRAGVSPEIWATVGR
jgi:hypothetical protein